MKHAMLSAALLAATLVATPAVAQDEPTPRFGVGLAAVGQMPVGDLADVAGPGFGGLASIEVGTYPGLVLTARSGYIQHLEEDDYSMSLIPILGGAKLTTGSVYLAGEIGAAITRVEYSGNNIFIDDETENTNLAWGVGIGSNVGPLDIRLMFNVWDADDMSESMTVGLNVGFTAFSW